MHPLQLLFEFSVLQLHPLNRVLIEIWVTLLKMFQPLIQLPQNTVQMLEETLPAVCLCDSPEILPDRSEHLFETSTL